MDVAIPTATKPTFIDTRAPYTTRASTSLPRSSVPSGCAAEGGRRMFATSIRSGFCDVNSAGNAATRKKNTMTSPPATASRFRSSLRAMFRPMPTLPLMRASSRADPRVRKSVRDVGDQVAEQREDRADRRGSP